MGSQQINKNQIKVVKLILQLSPLTNNNNKEKSSMVLVQVL
jgi:hypothetical protein